jgi:ABC-2 type transport system permease protein
MNEMRALLVAETRLLFREPIYWLAVILLPTAILVIFGSIFGPSGPDPVFGGLRFVDVFVPSLVVITVATLGLQMLPIRLATYREKGVLRRLSTTPAHPSRLLIAQFVVYTATAVIALALLTVVASVWFGVPWPQEPVLYVLAFALGLSSLFAIGLIFAALAPSVGVATAVALPTFFVVMLLGGVYVPRVFLPEIMIRIGEFTPPGVQTLQDAWLGTAPQLAPLAALAAITVVGGLVASRSFRWE